MAPIVYHVVPHEGRWAVQRGEADRPTRVAEAQSDAVALAEGLARHQAPARVVVHGLDGLVQTIHSFEAVPAGGEGGHAWLDVVLSKPVLVAAGVAALVAVGYSLRARG